ncbi:MAG: GreA/GreB family elongation factor [Acidobacteriota bacterium]
MSKSKTIYITKTDEQRLTNLIQLVRDQNEPTQRGYVNILEEGLEVAEIVAPEEIPPDVVTMRSKLQLKDLQTNEKSTYSIVFPTEADLDAGKISILAPLATALLGHRSGDIVEFQAPSRLRKLLIQEIIYQPESAGEYDL